MSLNVRNALWSLVVLSMAQGCGTAPDPGEEARARNESNAAVRADVHERTFDKVWTELRDGYYDPEFGGHDWAAMGEEYRARLSSVSTDDELHRMLNEMLNRLGQSHLGIIGGGAFEEWEVDEDGEATPVDADRAEAAGADAGTRGHVGMDVRLVEGRPTVVTVESGGPAEQAGLRPGFILTRVAGRDTEKAVSRTRAARLDEATVHLSVSRSIAGLLEGETGTKVPVTYLDGDNEAHEAVLVRRKDQRKWVSVLNLPPAPVSCEARSVKGGVGYITFNIFLMQLLQPIREAAATLKDAPAVILDLRGNPGGIGGMAMPVAGLFMSEAGQLGTMKGRENNARFPVFPSADPLDVPMAILVDERSASTSEMLAGGLQELGRAVVVGTPTAGMVLPSILKTLPTGARLQYPIMNFLTPEGRALEGVGVIPDVIVPLSRAALLRGEDNVMEAARRLLLLQDKPRSKGRP